MGHHQSTDPAPEVNKMILVTQGPGPDSLEQLRGRWPMWTAAHAPDIIDLEVRAVPLVYVADAGRVLAVGTPTDREGLLSLVSSIASSDASGPAAT